MKLFWSFQNGPQKSGEVVWSFWHKIQLVCMIPIMERALGNIYDNHAGVKKRRFWLSPLKDAPVNFSHVNGSPVNISHVDCRPENITPVNGTPTNISTTNDLIWMELKWMALLWIDILWIDLMYMVLLWMALLWIYYIIMGPICLVLM